MINSFMNRTIISFMLAFNVYISFQLTCFNTKKLVFMMLTLTNYDIKRFIVSAKRRRFTSLFRLTEGCTAYPIYNPISRRRIIIRKNIIMRLGKRTVRSPFQAEKRWASEMALILVTIYHM